MDDKLIKALKAKRSNFVCKQKRKMAQPRYRPEPFKREHKGLFVIPVEIIFLARDN